MLQIGKSACRGRVAGWSRLSCSMFSIPAWLIRGVLAALHPIGLSQYGPEQVDFLRYRPVLSNARLQSEFGYKPRKSTRECFDAYWHHRNARAEH